MRRLVLVLLAVAAVPLAEGQPAAATTADGRTVLLFDDHVWVDAADVADGLRAGEPDTSATGRFVVHVPEGWSASPPTGEMLQGEILFRHLADSTYLSPQFVPDQEEMPVVAQHLLDTFVDVMAPAGDVAEPTRAQFLDGRRVLSRRVVTEAEGGVFILQVTTIDAPGGIVLVIGAIPPGVPEASHEALLRSIEVLE